MKRKIKSFYWKTFFFILFFIVGIIVSILEKKYYSTSHVMEAMKIIIPITGWFIVYYLNSKNMREEKKLTVKKEAYNDIKPVYTDLMSSTIDLSNIISDIIEILKTEIKREIVKNDRNKTKITQSKIIKLQTKLKELENHINKFEKNYNRLLNVWDENIYIFKSADLNLNYTWETCAKIQGNLKRLLIKEKIEKNEYVISYDDYKDIYSNIKSLYELINDFIYDLSKLKGKIQSFVFEDLF